MKGTWGRRVFGTVSRGPRTTRFHLEVRIRNGLVVTRDKIVSNIELEAFPKLYGFVLDEMVYHIDQQVKRRNYTF